MAPPKKRKIKITIKSRHERDPLSLLKAVETAFRPKEIEIELLDSDIEKNNWDDDNSVADEQLEQEMREKAGKFLDDKARKQEETQQVSVRPVPKEDETSTTSIVIKRKNIFIWLVTFLKNGYYLTVRAITDSLSGK